MHESMVLFYIKVYMANLEKSKDAKLKGLRFIKLCQPVAKDLYLCSITSILIFVMQTLATLKFRVAFLMQRHRLVKNN